MKTSAWGNFNYTDYKVKKIFTSESRTKDEIKFLINEFRHSEYLKSLVKSIGQKAVVTFIKDLDYKEYNDPQTIYSAGIYNNNL